MEVEVGHVEFGIKLNGFGGGGGWDGFMDNGIGRDGFAQVGCKVKVAVIVVVEVVGGGCGIDWGFDLGHGIVIKIEIAISMGNCLLG